MRLRNIVITCSLLAMLAACKSDEESAREKLTEAVELARTAAAIEDPVARWEQLSSAQAILETIRSDYAGSSAALSIASGEVIGAVSLAEFPAQLEEARQNRDATVESNRIAEAIAACSAAPELACLLLPPMQFEAARRGVGPAEVLAEIPAEVRVFIDLIDHHGAPLPQWSGQVRPANDEPLLRSLTMLLEAGREDAIRDWMAATTAAPGSELTDFAAFLRLAAEYGSGRNLDQRPTLHEAIARLLESDREAALHLVLRQGSPETLRSLLASEPDGPAAVEQWVRDGMLYEGSDAMGIFAIGLWEAGDKDAAREIFASPLIREHQGIIRRIDELATQDAARDLLQAALPLAEGEAASRVAMALIATGPEGAPQGLAALREHPDLLTQIEPYASETASALGESNAREVFDELQAISPAISAETRARLDAGWHMGRALAGDDSAAVQILTAVPDSLGLFLANTLLTELVSRGETERAEAVYAAMGIADMTPGDGKHYIVNLALLAGDFTRATDWMRQFQRGTLFRPEEALRRRLTSVGVPGDDVLFPLLTALDPHLYSGSAAALARTDHQTGRGQPELAARYALSLTGEAQAMALGRMLEAWPGRPAEQ